MNTLKLRLSLITEPLKYKETTVVKKGNYLYINHAGCVGQCLITVNNNLTVLGQPTIDELKYHFEVIREWNEGFCYEIIFNV